MIDSFIEITRESIEEDGIEDFLPVLLFPDREAVHVLGYASSSINHEPEALAWVDQAVTANENYLLAYKIDEQRFKVVACINGNREERLCSVSAG